MTTAEDRGMYLLQTIYIDEIHAQSSLTMVVISLSKNQQWNHLDQTQHKSHFKSFKLLVLVTRHLNHLMSTMLRYQCTMVKLHRCLISHWKQLQLSLNIHCNKRFNISQKVSKHPELIQVNFSNLHHSLEVIFIWWMSWSLRSRLLCDEGGQLVKLCMQRDAN